MGSIEAFTIYTKRFLIPSTKEFLKERRKYLIFAVVCAVVMWSAIQLWTSHYLLAITMKQHMCLPYKVWIIDKKQKQFSYGSYISFYGKGIMNFQDGVRWVKVVGGLPGDRIEVVPVRKPTYRTVYVNDMPMVLPVRATVRVIRGYGLLPLELDVYEKDTKGRLMPVIQSQVIPEGKYFVYTDHERSFDSRYWGLVDESQVIGTGIPLF